MDKEFLKQLTILFVEDEDSVREFLKSAVVPFFKKCFFAPDGEEALLLFEENKETIDAIVSDIDMPKLNGLGLLKEIRQSDKKIPFIFATGHAEVDYLMEAITFKATGYVIKPIDMSSLLDKIHEACHERNSYKIIDTKRKQLEQYLDVINKVAIISRTDLQGNITFVNDIFCTISGYTQEELMGQPHNIIRHPDMPAEVFKELWEVIQSGKEWSGKVKNRAKNGEAYYVNATIIPVLDDMGGSIIEYVGIRFITTQDELEKREFKKRVISSINQSRKLQIDSQKQIIHLENELKKLENVDLLHDSLIRERKKSAKVNAQLLHYEQEIVEVRHKNEKLIDDTNSKVRKAVEFVTILKGTNEKLEKETSLLKNEIDNKARVLKELQNQVSEQHTTIKNLREVIAHREDQLAQKR